MHKLFKYDKRLKVEESDFYDIITTIKEYAQKKDTDIPGFLKLAKDLFSNKVSSPERWTLPLAFEIHGRISRKSKGFLKYYDSEFHSAVCCIIKQCGVK